MRWQLALVVMILALYQPLVRADESRELFNGKDLDGWVMEGPREFKDKDGKVRPMWQVRDGLLTTAGRSFGFLRWTRQEFADFALHVEYRLTPRGNSGIGIRTRPFDPKESRATRPSFYSYEIQLLDDAGQRSSAYGSGSLYRYVAPRVNPVRPAGQWNFVDILCDGPRIYVRINGEDVLDIDQEQIDDLVAKPRRGYVALQSHSNPVEFRNVRIREILPRPER